MISLKGPSTHTRIYESNEIEITESASSATVVALAHNFGTEPDKVEAYLKNPTTGVWEEPWDYWSDPAGQSRGFYRMSTSNTVNTQYVSVYFTYGGTVTYKFKCYKFNTISRNFEPFTWSTNEQIYPFEKAIDGSVLYCKEVNCGTLPNNGTKLVAHNISSLSLSKVHSVNGLAYYESNYLQCLPQSNPGYDVTLALTPTDIHLQTVGNYTNYTTKVKIIYAK